MGLFDNVFGTKPRKRRKKSKRKATKRRSVKKRVSKSKFSTTSPKINKDFKKIKKILTSFNPRVQISPHALKTKDEKNLEDKLFTFLAAHLGNGMNTQVKKRIGIVDLAYKKVGIEIKLCKIGGVKRIRDRLNRQVKDYSKQFKKLVIYVLNFEKDSGQDNAYIKRFLEKEFGEIKSVKKRDIAIIIRKV